MQDEISQLFQALHSLLSHICCVGANEIAEMNYKRVVAVFEDSRRCHPSTPC